MILRPQIARAFKPLLPPRRYKGAKGGRGGAKSHFFATLAIMEAVTGHQKYICAREVQNSIADSVKALLEAKISKFGLDGSFKITETEIAYPKTDTTFAFRGLLKHTVSSVKSFEGATRLWVEEAQTVSQRSLDISIPTIRAPGSQIWFSWNPEDEGDPVDKMFAEAEAAADPDFACVHVNYDGNPWFPEELRREMERDRSRDPEKYAHIWLGQYKRNSEARVFKNWKVEAFETPENSIFYFGADWGFSVDPTVLVRCWINGRTLFVDHEAYRVGCEIDHTPELFDRIENGMARKWVIRADSARPETISYMARNGYPKIMKALKGPSSVMDGIEFLKSYDIVVHPRCKHTIDELTFYSFKVDPKSLQVTPILEDKKNHVIDALRYAVEGVRRAPPVAASGSYSTRR